MTTRFDPADRQKLLSWPSRSPIAMQMFSSTVSPRKNWLIWKVRASPRRARSACAQPVMSWPSSSTRPAVRRQHASDQVDERRLARAVRPDQRMPRAALEREIDVAGDMQRAERAVELVALRGRRSCLSPCLDFRPTVLGDAKQAPSANMHHDNEQQADAELPESSGSIFDSLSSRIM